MNSVAIRFALVSLTFSLISGWAIAQPALLPEPKNLAPAVNGEHSTRSVTVRFSILKVDEAFFNRPDAEAWTDLSPKVLDSQSKILDDDVAQRFCRTVRAQKVGTLDAQPMLTTLNGQAATFTYGGDITWISTVSFEVQDGKTVPKIKTSKIDIGTIVECTPQTSADGKSCELDLKVKTSQLASIQPAPCEITFSVPSKINGKESQTAAICPKNIDHRGFTAKPTVPVGRCVMIYIDSEKSAKSVEHRVILATPTVIETASLPNAIALPQIGRVAGTVSAGTEQVSSFPVALLDERLAQYRKACADERWADARRLAAACLELDPRCFLPK